METVKAEAVCLERYLENGTFIHDCDLHIEAKVPANSYTIIKVEYDFLTDVELPENAIGNVTVENDVEKYTYLGENVFGTVFKLEKYGEEYHVAFDIRAYTADPGGHDFTDRTNTASGAYIFKPAFDDKYSHRYGNFFKIFYYRGQIVTEIHLILNDVITGANMSVRIRALRKQAYTVWDVLLYGIPV